MNTISETATIEDGVVMGNDNIIDDYVLLKQGTVLGDGNVIGRFSRVGPSVIMGDGNTLDFQVVLGGDPQDLGYRGEKTYLRIGSHNTFREFVTAHRGAEEGSSTVIGDHNFFMGYTHVAHNCSIGNRCVLTNYVGLAGHAVLEDHCIFGGHSGSHQFCRLGTHSMVGGMTKVNFDVPPYVIADGVPSRVRRVNAIGLKRQGFSDESIARIEACYEILYTPGTDIREGLAKISETFPNDPYAKRIIDFCAASKRGIMRHYR